MASSTSSASTASRMVFTPVGSDTTQVAINQPPTPPVEHVDTDQFAPRMEDFNITREKRQQLRGLLITSQSLVPDKKARQGRSNGLPLTDDERKMYYEDLDETVRWNNFLVYSGLNVPEVVGFVSYVYNVNEEEHQRALAKAVESHESFNTTTCDNIQKHAMDLIKANQNLRELDNVALTQKIGDSFSPDKFFAAFAFMEDYLNFEGSSPLGKWYAKGIFINMTRTIVRWSCDGSKPDQWDKVLDTFEKMALLEVHDTVDIMDFSKLTHQYRYKKDWAEVESGFVPVGPAPGKQEPCASSDVKVPIHSADPEERLHDSQALDGGDGGAHDAHSKSQQGSPTPLNHGTYFPVQRQTTENESDSSSKKQSVHSDDENISKYKGPLAGKQVPVWDFVGFGYRSDDKDTSPEKVKEVKASNDGGFGTDVDVYGFEARAKEQMEARKAREAKKAKTVKTRGDGGFTDQGIFPFSASSVWDWRDFGCSKTTPASPSSS